MIFYSSAKVYATNYFVFEIRKHDTIFLITFYYYFVFSHSTNADLKICRYIRFQIKKYAEGFTLKQIIEIYAFLIKTNFVYKHTGNFKVLFSNERKLTRRFLNLR